MLLQCPIDQGVEPTGPLILLDLLVPPTFGTILQPGPDEADLILRKSCDGGGDLLDRAHECLADIDGLFSSGELTTRDPAMQPKAWRRTSRLTAKLSGPEPRTGEHPEQSERGPWPGSAELGR